MLALLSALRPGVAVQGSTFGEICGMTDKFEGCVVREMRRLDELLKNLHLAAKVTNQLSMLAKNAWHMHPRLSIGAFITRFVDLLEHAAGHW